jgi:ABC-type amino acid transport substrate-binding protein
VKATRIVVLTVIAITLAACLPLGSPEPSPTATPSPTSARPRFELASYMYALQTKGKIRIGALDKAAPFSSREASGRYTGFEPDLGRELARAIFGPRQDIDTVIEWIPVDRGTAVAALTSLRADVVVSRLTATDERATVIDLTDRYFVTGERILVLSSNTDLKDLADLDAKTVCVQSGSGVAAHIDAANSLARTLELDTYDSCVGALKAGQVDAIGADEIVLWNIIRTNSDTKVVGRPLVAERYAIGAKKGVADRQGFLPFLNAWLAGVIRDGTWGRLYAQHIAPLSKETKTTP